MSVSKQVAAAVTGAAFLAGCGGGGNAGAPASPPAATPASLNGNWFGELQTAGGPAYYNETLIAESGASVLLTRCDRSTEKLTRNGSQLFDREGQLYFLYVRDSDTLAGRPDLPSPSLLKKRSSIGRFDSGRATVTLPTGETVTADADVCAQAGTARFEDSLGNPADPYVVTVSLPYRDSFIRIDTAFRQAGIGQYEVLGFEPFVRTDPGARVATVTEFTSPLLAAADGGRGYMIASGTVQVSSYTRSAIVMSADLKTAVGTSLRFTASVRLHPRTSGDAAQ